MTEYDSLARGLPAPANCPVPHAPTHDAMIVSLTDMPYSESSTAGLPQVKTTELTLP